MKVLKTIGFWLIQCTWGFIMTFIGAIVTLSLMIVGKKPQHLGPIIYTKIGKNWGGLELGAFFICNENETESLKLHECGHAIQNMIFGPIYPFLIGIPSAIRYWLRKFKTHLTKSLFNLCYLISALILTTGLACITGPVLHIKWLTITIEIFRIYFLLISLWLISFEIRKYDGSYVEYDAIWFEKQATTLGYKIFNK